ncbi:MAG: LCP family protein [Clostridia bacterium]
MYPQAERPDWDLSEGMNHLTGEQALIHARNRSIGNSDYRRTERQREVLISAFTAMKSSDPITLVALINEAMPLLTTDMESSQILGYAMEILTMGVDDVQSFRIPANGMYSSAVIRKMQVLVPDLNQCRAYLREILYGEAG